jgi:hypothetical protein
MLPQQGDSGSRLPDYIHLSVNQKLIAAYVLGKILCFKLGGSSVWNKSSSRCDCCNIVAIVIVIDLKTLM